MLLSGVIIPWESPRTPGLGSGGREECKLCLSVTLYLGFGVMKTGLQVRLDIWSRGQRGRWGCYFRALTWVTWIAWKQNWFWIGRYPAVFLSCKFLDPEGDGDSGLQGIEERAVVWMPNPFPWNALVLLRGKRQTVIQQSFWGGVLGTLSCEDELQNYANTQWW